MDRTFGWDYPPGVSESMIPGNRPQDIAWENAIERAMNEMVDICQCNYEVCDFSQWTATQDHEWLGCSQHIVESGWKLGNGDMGDCPYLEGRAETFMDDLLNGVDPDAD